MTTKLRFETHVRLRALGTAVVLALCAIAARVDADEDAKKERVTYDDHIAPLFESKCVGCHNPDKKKGDLGLSTYSMTMEGGSSGSVIKPGDPDASRLFLLVDHQETPKMPPRGGKLPDTALATIRKWIETGAAESKTSKVRLPEKPKIDLTVKVDPGARPDGPPPLPRGLSLEPRVRSQRTSAVTAIAANPWSPLVAVAGQKQVLLYELDSLELAGILPFPEGAPNALKFSRNGTLLLAAGGRAAHSGRVVVWDVRSGDRVIEVGKEFDAVLAADISADHSLIALAGTNKLVRIFSTEDGELLHEIKKHTDWVFSLEFSPDGVLLATGDRSGGLHVWESFSGREYLTLRGHGGAVTDVSWRGDSNVLASASEDSTVRLWEMENGSQVRRWNAHGGGTLSVDFARDGRLVSAGRDRRSKLWQQDGKALRNFEPFPDLCLRVTISGDGKRVVAGDWTGEVRVWNAADGKRLAVLSTNPMSLATRVGDAQKRHASVAAERAPMAQELEALRAKRIAAQQDVNAAQASATKVGDQRKAVDAAIAARRKDADDFIARLRQALTALGEKELALEKLLDAKTPDAATIAKATTALDASRTSTKTLTESLAKSLSARTTAQKSLVAAIDQQRSAAAVVAQKAAALQAVNDQVSSKQKQLDAQAARLARVETEVTKWSAAIEIDRTLKEIESLEGELRKLEGALFAEQSERDSKAAELAATARSLEESTAAMQAASLESEKALAELATRSKASSEQSSKVLAAIRALSSPAGKDAKPEADSKKAREELVAMRKNAETLAAASQAATTAWENSQKTVDEHTAKTEATLTLFEKNLAALRAADAALEQAKTAVKKAEGSLKAVRERRADWATKFETASKALRGIAGGLTKS